MTVIRGGSEAEIRGQVRAAGGSEKDEAAVLGFTAFLRSHGQAPPLRKPRPSAWPEDTGR